MQRAFHVGAKIAKPDGVRGSRTAGSRSAWSRARGSAGILWRRARAAAISARVIRSVLAGVNLLSRSACASCAEIAFRRPIRSSPSRREARTLAVGELTRVRGRLGEVAVWHWGSGPRVLLVHGWGGHAGRLAAFVSPLLDAGFGVAAFDAPAHGISDGSLASLPDFVETVSLVAGVTGSVALIGHSMGAAACALAMRFGLPARGAVLLAPPADPEVYTARYARYMRLSADAARSMGERLERRYGVRFGDLRLVSGAPSTPVLVVHDRRDPRVPVRDGIAIARAWPGADLVVTRGLGHHRILRDARVIRRSVRFLGRTAAGPLPADWPRAAAPRREADPGAPGSARFLKEDREMAQSRASLRRLKL